MYPNQNRPYLYQPIVAYKPQQYMQTKLGRQQVVSGLRVALQTLETASRIIPLIAQLQPMLENAKTALHVIKAVKASDPPPAAPTTIIDVPDTSKTDIPDSENPILFHP
ncbi:MAG TPA: hypothetical protein IAD15_11840 [Candidatus Fimiplasma intestinipullorum]|uniref:YqfQ-like protein n=1 Tax=Candidatus Fimiplasma intestinipullorum TaxID=2840825 RepID=A0A9D1HQA4_9FIRM|nr:hypothetical protein [Candidatus Fimiplasma intestinipullorum]